MKINKKTFTIFAAGAGVFFLLYIALTAYAKSREEAVRSSLFASIANLGASILGMNKQPETDAAE